VRNAVLVHERGALREDVRAERAIPFSSAQLVISFDAFW